MKHYAFFAAIALLLITPTAYAAFSDPFLSLQVGTSPSNGYVLQTDGTNSSWVATSTLGITSGTSGAAYPFALTGNATSTLTQFNGGLTAFASSTIGAGAQTSGLTVLGGSTTTLNAYFAQNVGIGTSSPGYLLTLANTVSGGSQPPNGIFFQDTTTAGSTWPQSIYSGLYWSSLDGSTAGARMRAQFGTFMTAAAGGTNGIKIQLATTTDNGTNQMLDALTVSQSTGEARITIGSTTTATPRNFEVFGTDPSSTLASQGDASIGLYNKNTADTTFAELAFGSLNTNGAKYDASKIVGVNTTHTPGAESGDLVFMTKNAGTYAERARFDSQGYFRVSGTSPTMMGTYSAGYNGQNLLTIRAGSTVFGSTTAQIALEGQRAAIVAGDMLGAINFNTLDTQLAAAGASPGTTTAALVGVAEGSHNGSTNGVTGLAFYTTFGAYTNFAEKVRISGAGNLGIGTTTPFYKLSVEGSSTLGNQAIAGYFTATSSTASTFAGNVGVGTTSPWAQLSLNPNNIGSGPAFAIGSSTQTLFTVTNAGRVGIGITSPTSLLEVGSGYNLTNYTIRSGDFVIQPYAHNNGFMADNAYFNGAFTRLASGYASLFQFFNGQILFRNADTGTGTFSTNSISFKTDFSNSGSVALGGSINANPGNYTGAAMVVLGTGNVGIGSTTPGSLLSVGGNGTGTNFFDNATTTKSGVGGFNIAQGCFSINNVCIGGSGGVTSVTGTYPVISSGGTTPAISLAFGTTTSNIWAGTQTFTNASSTALSSNTLAVGQTGTTTISSTGALTTTGLVVTGNVTTCEGKPATSTTMVIDWSTTCPLITLQMGTAAFSVTFINATTTAQAGSRKMVEVCNPNASAGAITWNGAEWFGGTVPTQTTTANQCDLWSFYVGSATSTSAYKIHGAMSAGFQ